MSFERSRSAFVNLKNILITFKFFPKQTLIKFHIPKLLKAVNLAFNKK
ncbi:hypothetical protein J2X97_000516 [Epilithonimonas hungarica]|nr:hypothetical protein [Epilithonimonas hungarica]